MKTAKVRDLTCKDHESMLKQVDLYTVAGNPVSVTFNKDGTYRVRVYAFRAGD